MPRRCVHPTLPSLPSLAQLAGWDFDCMFYSPLARAAHTGAVVWGGRAAPALQLACLREIDLYSFQVGLAAMWGAMCVCVGGCGGLLCATLARWAFRRRPAAGTPTSPCARPTHPRARAPISTLIPSHPPCLPPLPLRRGWTRLRTARCTPGNTQRGRPPPQTSPLTATRRCVRGRAVCVVGVARSLPPCPQVPASWPLPPAAGAGAVVPCQPGVGRGAGRRRRRGAARRPRLQPGSGAQRRCGGAWGGARTGLLHGLLLTLLSPSSEAACAAPAACASAPHRPPLPHRRPACPQSTRRCCARRWACRPPSSGASPKATPRSRCGRAHAHVAAAQRKLSPAHASVWGYQATGQAAVVLSLPPPMLHPTRPLGRSWTLSTAAQRAASGGQRRRGCVWSA